MNRRNTLQRTIVLNVAQQLKHATAENIHTEIIKNYPEIGLATVYRNLNILVENNTLRKISTPHGPDQFDVTLAPHYHLKCKVCGKIFDVPLDYSESLDVEIEEKTMFSVDSHDILFIGECEECNKQNEKLSS